MSYQVRIPLLLFLPVLVVPNVRAGPNWPEVLDAGSGIGISGGIYENSQHVYKKCSSDTQFVIEGTLGAGGDSEDVFIIYILDPANFWASTDVADNGFTNFDSQLWLFRIDAVDPGKGLLANDDKLGGTGGASKIVADDDDDVGTQTNIPGKGLYALAISAKGNHPMSVGGAIFSIGGGGMEVSGPDGAGGANKLSGWFGGGPAASSTYRIFLNGAYSANIGRCPALSPSGLLLLAVALAVGGAVLFKRHARRLTQTSAAMR